MTTRLKWLEGAINRTNAYIVRLQERVKKLQSEYDRKSAKAQAKPAE